MTNYDLELYKVVIESVSECGWVSDNEFFVYPYLFELEDFIKRMKTIFGETLFDDGGIEAHIMHGYACLDLTLMLNGYDVDLKKLFPFEEFKH